MRSRRRRRRAAARGTSGASSSRPARSSASVAGQLEVRVPGAGPPEVGDPDRAVDRRPADRPVALGDELARRARAARSRGGRRTGGTRRRRPRRAPRDGPRRRGSCGPRSRCGPTLQSIARTSCFISGRARPITRAGLGSEAARAWPSSDAVDRLDQRVDRGAADLVPVDAALARPAHRERARGPDVAGVVVAVGLEHRHAPLARAELDRPVERGRARGRPPGPGARSGSGASPRSTPGSAS